MVNVPEWWEWELEFTPHLEKRMLQRRFMEVDVRVMMSQASGYRKDVRDEGRWVISSGFEGRPWEIVVEPDQQDRVLVVITAYPC
jgi:hypothetical protein